MSLLSYKEIVSYPTVFADESSFINNAMEKVVPGEFGDSAYQKRFTLIEETTKVQYGPTYFFLLSIFIRVFGITIESARLLSLVLCTGSVIVFSSAILAKFKNFGFAILSGLVVYFSYFFVNASHIARMESLVLFLGVLTIVLLKRKKTNTVVICLLGLLSLSTHFITGGIVCVYVALNYLFKKQYRYLIWFVLVQVVFLIIWFVHINLIANKEALNNSLQFAQGYIRILPWFNGFYNILLTNHYSTVIVIFVFYLFSYILLLYCKDKSKNLVFLLLTTLIILYGESNFYYVFLLLPFFSIALDLNKEKISFINILFIAILVSEALTLYLTINSTLVLGENYYELGKKFSQCIDDNESAKNIFVTIGSRPDFYMYLVANTKHKLYYEKFHGRTPEMFEELVAKSDYVLAVERDLKGYMHKTKYFQKYVKSFCGVFNFVGDPVVYLGKISK